MSTDHTPSTPRWSDPLLRGLQSAGVLQHPRPEAGDLLLVSGLALCFVLYFVVRGHLNAGLVLLFTFCGVRMTLGREPAWPAGDTGRQALWLIAALAAPFAVVGLTQWVHQEWVPKGFDSALRLAMSGVVLLHLIQRRINFVPIAERVLPLAVMVCAAAVLVSPHAAEHYWAEGRYATYFMDPLTLGQHIVILGFMGLFTVNASGTDSPALRALKYAALALALVVAVGTQSRSSWVMVPVLAALWLLGVRRLRSRLGIGVALAGFGLLCVLLYAAVPVVHERVVLAVSDYMQYFDGGSRDTSAGIRLSLWRANWLLFLDKPWAGWGYAHPPVLSQLAEIAPFYTEKLDIYFTQAGGHNEILTHMMRAGLPGLLSRLMVFGVPLVLFARAVRRGDARQRMAGYMGLALVLGYLTASINTEVFNLIYIASFYGLLTAALAATALYPPRESHEPH